MYRVTTIGGVGALGDFTIGPDPKADWFTRTAWPFTPAQYFGGVAVAVAVAGVLGVVAWKATHSR